MEEEIVQEFLTECREGLDRMDEELVRLEREPDSAELISSIFRVIHTIKGSSGCLGYERLMSLAHAGESLLSQLRDKQLQLNPRLTTALLSTVDAIRSMLAQIEEAGNDGEQDYTELVSQLEELREAPKTVIAPVEDIAAEPVMAAAIKETVFAALQPPELPDNATTQRDTPKPASGKIGGVLVQRYGVRPEDLAKALLDQEQGDGRLLGEILISMGVATNEQIAEALQILARSHVRGDAETIRVDVRLLDKLMNLVGELVLARNRIMQFSGLQQGAELAAAQQLNLVTTELREGMMRARMQPVSKVFDKLPRVVRDAALACGKNVNLDLQGRETELDKALLEGLSDALVHIVRNAVDHGVEALVARKAAGKNPTGKIVVKAFHESGYINIEVSDDGAGIPLDQIKNKAIERGLITPAQASRMDERDVLNLVFLPGLSTAEKVTNISGRGVGMDVVRTNIERLGGSVDIQSKATKGSVIRIRVPLTLAIVPALILKSSRKRFALPQTGVMELVRIEPNKIQHIQNAPFYRLRGDLLPLVSLAHETQNAADQEESARSCTIVVLHVDAFRFGLIVDRVDDTEEIVVRALGTELKDVQLFAGATILGNGDVVLILDVLALARKASMQAKQQHKADNEPASAVQVEENKKKYLLLKAGSESQIAVPLASILRLEKFAASQMEYLGGRQVVNYRGRVMPLLELADQLQRSALTSTAGKRQALICIAKNQEVGILVDRIVDVVEENLQNPDAADELISTAILSGRALELLDLDRLVQQAG